MLRESIHTSLYLLALCVIALFLPISKYVVSAAQIFIILNWILELNFKEKFKKLISDKGIILFTLLFTVPTIWLINSENIGYALNDLKIKLPLLALPIIIGTSKSLSEKKNNFILLCFITGVFISTLAAVFANNNIFISVDTSNVRNLSVFVSHIRLSLMLCLSIFIITYWVYNKTTKTKIFILLGVLLIIWFIYSLSLIQGFTGLVALITLTLLLLIKLSTKENNKYKRAFYILALILFLIAILGYIGFQIKKFYTPTQPSEIYEKKYTAKGNPYYNDYNSNIIENGNLVKRNISYKELYEEWPKRSNFTLKGKDEMKQPISYTLIRYLASKGLTKDAEGLSKLSDDDIRNIEKGETNYKYANVKSIEQRIYTIIWQLDLYTKIGDPSGHSVSQRIEYNKIGFKLFRNNLLFGTGTGDVDDEFKALYNKLNSSLSPKYRHRAHNQLLTFFISFGIIGGIICLLAWFVPIVINWEKRNYFFLIFFVIATLSMLADDTLETTTGVVFCSYFYSLFLWGKR